MQMQRLLVTGSRLEGFFAGPVEGMQWGIPGRPRHSWSCISL